MLIRKEHRMKGILPIILLLSAATALAQNVNAWLDYPLEYAQLTGAFNSPVSAKQLFESGALISRPNDDGQVALCKVDKRTRQKNVVTYLLTSSVGGKPLVKFVVQIQVDDAQESALLTYFKMTVVSTGNVAESQYDGTVDSAGEVWGMFLSMSQIIFDADKVNALLET